MTTIPHGTALGTLVDSQGRRTALAEGSPVSLAPGVEARRVWDSDTDLLLAISLGVGVVARNEGRPVGGRTLLAPGTPLSVGQETWRWSLDRPVPVTDLARCGFDLKPIPDGRGARAISDDAAQRTAGATLVCPRCARAFWGDDGQ